MDALIETENLSYMTPTGTTVLQELSIHVYPGEFIGILGKNGAGKTTLLDIIMGQREATTGSISVIDENPFANQRKNLEAIAFLAHDSTVKSDISVEEFLAFHAHFYKKYNKQLEKRFIEEFSIDVKSKIGALSTGQQRKAQIVAAFASMARLVLIDEVTAVLDPNTRSIFFKIVEEYTKLGNTVLLATNIALDLKKRADKIIFINDTKSTIVENAEKIDELFELTDVA